MLSEILNNPYRILGVFSNSPKKEQLANKAKMQAFLRVGKSMPFKQDMKEILPEINRTQELIDSAESELALVAGQIKHAQFWFINQTPLDKVAFNHLYSGEIELAMVIWYKAKTVSSLQNLLVCYLIKGDYKAAILECAIPLYEELGNAFVSSIDSYATISTRELVENFIDVLLKENVDLASLSKEIKNEVWSKSIRKKTVVPLLHQIDALISKAKEERTKGPQACFTAGTKLKADSKKPFDTLHNLLPADDSQYQIEADKLALEILQCAIDYYNASKDFDKARRVLSIVEYVLSIAVGERARQRCKKNVEIIRRAAEALSPTEVAERAAKIQEILAKYRNMSATCESALWLLKEVHNSLVEIKEKVGASNKLYLELSSNIGNAALNYIIDDVNRSIKDYEDYKTTHAFFKTELYFEVKVQQKIEVVRNTLKAAWKTILKLESLDKDASLKQRYEDNKLSLINLIKDFNSDNDNHAAGNYTRREGNYGSGNNTNSNQSDAERYKRCTTRSSLEQYLKDFPNGKYRLEAEKKIAKIKKEDKFFKIVIVFAILWIIGLFIFSQHNRNSSQPILPVKSEAPTEYEEEYYDNSSEDADEDDYSSEDYEDNVYNDEDEDYEENDDEDEQSIDFDEEDDDEEEYDEYDAEYYYY